MERDGLVEGGDEFIGERGDVWKGERKRNSESMWRVKGSANGRYVKDEERGKGRPILYYEQAIDRTVFLHSVDTQTW